MIACVQRQPIRFTDEHEGIEFAVQRDGRRIILVDTTTGGRYQISRLMERDWSIITRPKIHPTLFNAPAS